MSSNRPLKVYGWQGHRYECPPARNGSQQTREIVAAHSVAEVLRITGFKRSHLFNICETGNDVEIALATANPGVVYWKPLDLRGIGVWTRGER